MIRYALRCTAGHDFESWFQSASAFDALAARGLVSCPVCGAAEVEKTLMSPSLRPVRKAAKAVTGAVTEGPLSGPATVMQDALATLKREIEKNSEYVGMNFAIEARRIHAGNAPERAIYGEARPDEARKLIEDGVPVSALPFLPTRKTN
ncbi:MAG: DUF1178 family protein [Pseudorhodobacter sp.]|nr:DUF1178 family protein [Pseudorhodobacter sp.]